MMYEFHQYDTTVNRYPTILYCKAWAQLEAQQENNGSARRLFEVCTSEISYLCSYVIFCHKCL